MGQGPAVLLVIGGAAWAWLLAGLFGGLFGLCANPAMAAVKAEDYHAFWLWSGVRTQPVLNGAKTLYVLQGQVSAPRNDAQAATLIAQGMGVRRLPQPEVWLVYRAHTLHWPAPVYQQLLGQVQRWQAAGNALVGVQLDFDARTRYLHEYVAFLQHFRQRLPAQYKLSITGLMDWGSNADPHALAQLNGLVDEVVVQTYQGRHSIEGYAAYLPRLGRMALPFKIGVVQGGEWHRPLPLEASPWFRGYVVFLQNGR